MRKNLDYTKYSAEDFCQDRSFLQWVRKEDSKSILFWDSWTDRHLENKNEILRARAIILGMGVVEPIISNQRINALRNKIDREIDNQSGSKESNKGFSIFKIAASVSVLIATCVLLYWFSGLKSTESQSISSVVNTIEKANKAGEKSIFRLPDGSKIILNADSKLSFPEEFSDSSRAVTLVGEAYFEVTRDASRPFTITSQDIVTTVLGTSFNISAYPFDEEIKVAVSSGKVSVKDYEDQKQRSEWTLSPNEMTIFQKESRLMKKTSFDNLKEMGWKDGIIYFKDAGMGEILSTLTQWYGVEFVTNKDFTGETDYSGTFDNKPLNEVLEGIGFVFDFRYKIKNKTVTIN